MLPFFLFHLIDPVALGRVDKASLSQQTLMELFTEGFGKSKAILCFDSAEAEDISMWKNVELNKNHEVSSANWETRGLSGSLQLEWMPPTFEKIVMWGNSISGSLDLTVLPSSLKTFDASHNRLTGTLNLEELPPSLERLLLQYNAFQGPVSLRKLPESMYALHLSRNQLSGSIDLTSLPSSITSLFLRENDFSGLTDFTKLPSSLRNLDISDTNLEGEIFVESGSTRGRDFLAKNSQVTIHLAVTADT